MELERYEVEVDRVNDVYSFWSNGPNGMILKVVVYSQIKKNVYNLGFGDWDDFRSKINDTARSNNDDMDKVLATVGSTILDFMKRRPFAIVEVEGSTAARTRLYQMKVARHLNDVKHLFKVKGWYSGRWQPFVSGRNYKRLRLHAH
jgi:hypothetical protein